MPNPKIDFQKRNDELLEDYQKLHQKPDVTGHHIAAWLLTYINECNKLITGKTGKKLQKLSGLSEHLEVVHGCLKLTLLTVWDYKSTSRGEPPNLVDISKFLSDIKIRKTPATLKSRMEAVVTIDLEKWPNLISNCMYSNLYVMALSHDKTDWITTRKQADLNLLLKHCHPNITMETLNIAMDLGILENGPIAFSEWLNSPKINKESHAEALPSNLVY